MNHRCRRATRQIREVYAGTQHRARKAKNMHWPHPDAVQNHPQGDRVRGQRESAGSRGAAPVWERRKHLPRHFKWSHPDSITGNSAILNLFPNGKNPNVAEGSPSPVLRLAKERSLLTEGCLMFAKAYVGDRDGTKPLTTLLLRGQTGAKPNLQPLKPTTNKKAHLRWVRLRFRCPCRHLSPEGRTSFESILN